MKALAAITIATAGLLAAAAARAAAPASPLPKASAKHDSLVADMDCDACHTTDGWKMTGVAGGGGFDHSKTGFPLTGEHARTTCVGCHVPGRTISRECSSCHADAHEGRLGTGCDGCHDAKAWRATQAIEAHRKTRLPLTGMHALIDCSSCHLRTGEAAFADVPSDCFSCHEKQYRSQTTHPSHEGNLLAGQTPFPHDCAVCHTAVGWTPAFLPASFLASAVSKAPIEHERFFPIRSGTHRGAACASCHPGGDGAPVDCQGCHEHSPLRMISDHRGRAVPSDSAGCLGCHPGGAPR